jgi:phosphoribosyl 1,2-cyclic phosphodiesterase
VYATRGTRGEVPFFDGLLLDEPVECGCPFQIGEITLEAFPVPHDSAEPVGYRVLAEGIQGVVATDLGEMTELVISYTNGCDWLILESNHDEQLLQIGPYPWLLKRRVLGKQGHLSNQSLADFLTNYFDGHANHLFLAHLSRQNNVPKLAAESASNALCERVSSARNGAIELHLTHQFKPSIVLEL